MSRWDQTDRELALGGLLREDGQADRLFPPTELMVPAGVELLETADGPALDDSVSAEHGHVRSDTSGLLEAFSRLEDAPPERFLAFARAWGVLRLCEHRLPASHNPGGICSTTAFEPEPIDSWRRFSRQASALMRIAGRLHQAEKPAAGDWRVVYEAARKDAPWWERDVELERIKLADVVGEWLRIGNVRPVPVWHVGDGQLKIELAVGGLFGAIARELAFLVARVDGLAPCAECGRSFVPRRRPSAGRRSFCLSCRAAGAPHKHANRDLRARQRT